MLSGGGSLGAVQVGMLRALFEREVQPDLIVGTSVGAVNGGFLASRPPTVETAAALAEIWLGLGRWEVFPPNPVSGFLGFFGFRSNLVPVGGLRELIDRHVEFDDLVDAPIPLHVLATDLLSGREARLSEGDARLAIEASAAIPGVFPAVDFEGRALIDGGVSNNTPITDAIELGAERIYVLPTGNACALEEPPRGAVAMLLHAMSLLVMRRLLLEVDLLKDRAELIILPPPCPLAIPPIDFSHTEELISRGYLDADQYLEQVSKGQAPVPLPMAMHGHRPTTGEKGKKRAPAVAN